VASQTRLYTFASGIGRNSAGAQQLDIVAGLPEGLWLPAGFTIVSETLNIQAGDQWGTTRLIVELWGL
jgi:hypothetical protein